MILKVIRQSQRTSSPFLTISDLKLILPTFRTTKGFIGFTSDLLHTQVLTYVKLSLHCKSKPKEQRNGEKMARNSESKEKKQKIKTESRA
jgi:hypothetical protein